MKTNGHNLISSDYYIGFDVGTNSVGWAVTDTEYNILKYHSNAMWGSRLFDEASDAAERRGARSARRRLARRKQRLELLELLFNDEIRKIDPNFFIRLKESSLQVDDRSIEIGKYSLFADVDFTDKDYLKKYPTVYHLRSELVHSKEPHDIRLIYLALHHIIKNRGHFLFDGESGLENETVSQKMDEIIEYVAAEYGEDISVTDRAKTEKILTDGKTGISVKKKAIRLYIAPQNKTEDTKINIASLFDLLCGATVKTADLFCDEELKNADIKSICLKDDIDEKFDELSAALGDRVELILLAKKTFDIARLSQILGTNTYISDAKIELYKKNASDLRALKEYVKTKCPEKKQRIFSEKRGKLNNYAAYSGYKMNSGEYTCTQEEFCAFLKNELPVPAEDENFRSQYEEICSKIFLTKLKGTDNGIIPNQLHRAELTAILSNASEYKDFLNRKDTDGLTVSEKIISIFDFKLSYYVGPLNKKSTRSWVIRTADKIYPWNFEKIVDKEKSALAFITELIGRCTYTGEYVLPADSLLYSEYALLNEINCIKLNGRSLTTEEKNGLIREKFKNSNKKVTKKDILNYLISIGSATRSDEISGIDDTVKSKLKSYHDFRNILQKNGDEAMVEDIIQSILIFSEDKKMLKNYIRKTYKALDEKDIAYICRLKYKDWGRLSKEFLTGIYHVDENGEAHSVIGMLRTTQCNLMQLLSSDYGFMKAAEEYRNEKFGNVDSLDKKLDEMYISPAVRRSLRQTLRIVDEIVDIKKSAPKKIFIEVARGSKEEVKNKRTESRKNKLIELYKACGEDSSELFARLESEPEDKLRSDKLYLYYTQFGKCMYSGENIDLAALLNDNTHYDIDHIYPRSKIKDNSLTNRVLVKSELNREKTNDYPIKAEICTKMYSTWKALKGKGLISDEKFARLTRNTSLTEKELSDFVARQVVETQQSTKALASLFKEYYPNTKPVYSKAGNVSDFRQEYEFIKCRDINDLHHAKDAYLNIVVGNVYDTKFTEQFFKNILNENYSLNKVFAFNVPGAWDKDKTIATVRKYMAKNNILFTRMPHENKGMLFKATIYPKGEGIIPIKKHLPIEKYGGYSDRYAAFFIVVEHTSGKKRIRTIEPVYIYALDLFNSDSKKYCTDVLELVDPVVTCKKILIDSFLEIEGARLNITGGSNSKGDGRDIYNHAYQLAIDNRNAKKVKDILKYLDRLQKNENTVITEHDNITFESNMELYDFFMNKINTRVYSVLFSKEQQILNSSKDVFARADLTVQCKIIAEIIKLFRCDASVPNLTELCGSKAGSRIRKSVNITKMKSIFLINQSVTGLYEYKADLLK